MRLVPHRNATAVAALYSGKYTVRLLRKTLRRTLVPPT